MVALWISVGRDEFGDAVAGLDGDRVVVALGGPEAGKERGLAGQAGGGADLGAGGAGHHEAEGAVERGLEARLDRAGPGQRLTLRRRGGLPVGGRVLGVGW